VPAVHLGEHLDDGQAQAGAWQPGGARVGGPDEPAEQLPGLLRRDPDAANGAGKTTTMRIILGLAAPTSAWT